VEGTVVIALGGNAILRRGQSGTAEEQLANLRATAEQIAEIIAADWRVILTHGNGPQVGNILLQNEEARHVVPPMPLDVCGAESQGQIGYLLQRALQDALRVRGMKHPVATVVTMVVVDENDPAFQQPTKPIGPCYSEARARELMERKGYIMKQDTSRGWRRVVPSPEPKRICEREAIRGLVELGVVTIACGGGGIPVVVRGDRLVGVEAVIDKDLASQRLASELGADVLLILTDVDGVAVNWQRPDQRFITSMTVQEARKYQAEGHFPPGSMGPKVEAAVRFVSGGGERAVICSIESALAGLEGKAGTTIVP